MAHNKPILIVGHRSPDTDSIMSALSYANLKRSMGVNAIAARCGALNNESKYALDYFHVTPPVMKADLYPRVKDVALECKTVVRQHDTLRHLGEVMRKAEVQSVPVVDSKGELVGIVTVGDLAKRYFLELGLQSLVDLPNINPVFDKSGIGSRICHKPSSHAARNGVYYSHDNSWH